MQAGKQACGKLCNKQRAQRDSHIRPVGDLQRRLVGSASRLVFPPGNQMRSDGEKQLETARCVHGNAHLGVITRSSSGRGRQGMKGV